MGEKLGQLGYIGTGSCVGGTRQACQAGNGYQVTQKKRKAKEEEERNGLGEEIWPAKL
jgi:hypothetical protein